VGLLIFSGHHTENCSLVIGEMCFDTKNTAWARYRVTAVDGTRNNFGPPLNFTDIYIRM